MPFLLRASSAFLLAGLMGCATRARPAAPPATQPPRTAPPAAKSPALAAFLAAAGKMGITLAPPAGYAEVAVRDNDDCSYDYAIASADRRIEMRFALRPYAAMPEPLRNLQMSFVFFMTGISNLVRGGDDGTFAKPQPLPAAHFHADDARLIAVRWFRTELAGNAFGEGYEAGSVVFMHRDRIGDAYAFVLFKNLDAIDAMDEDKMHVMRFADR